MSCFFLLQKVSACTSGEHEEEDNEVVEASADDDDQEEITDVDHNSGSRDPSKPPCRDTSSKPSGSKGGPYKSRAIFSSSDFAEVKYFEFGRAKIISLLHKLTKLNIQLLFCLFFLNVTHYACLCRQDHNN